MKKMFIGLFFIIFTFKAFGAKENLVSVKENGENQNFIVKKDQKKSKSKMQEDLCESFADGIAQIANLQEKLAKIQKSLIDQTCKYIDGSGSCMILKGDKSKIDEALRVSKNFEDKMENFLQDCKKYLEYINK